MTTFYLFIFI